MVSLQIGKQPFVRPTSWEPYTWLRKNQKRKKTSAMQPLLMELNNKSKEITYEFLNSVESISDYNRYQYSKYQFPELPKLS